MNDDDLCGARPADPFTSTCDRERGHPGAAHRGLALGDTRPDGSRGVIDRVLNDEAPKQQRGMRR
jgi:hypothetical protein